MYFRMTFWAKSNLVLYRIGTAFTSWYDMMKMFDIVFTHQAFFILLFSDSSFDIIKSFQWPILKINAGDIRIFHLHKCKPVYLNCNICDRQIPADFFDDIQMSLDQVVHSWRQPILTSFPVTKSCFCIPDKLTGYEFISGILRKFPHNHAGFNHDTASFARVYQTRAGFYTTTHVSNYLSSDEQLKFVTVFPPVDSSIFLGQSLARFSFATARCLAVSFAVSH